ncbi:sigma-54 interaction domain-containing protein [Fibrobacterota bacterium]
MDISKHVSSSLDYKEITYRCLVSLTENLDLEKCSLLMPEKGKNYLEIRVGIDWESAEAEDLRFSISDSVSGKVFASGIPVAVQDVNDLSGLYIPENLTGREGITGFIAVPVLVNGRPIGVLTAFKVSNRTMLDEDVKVMKIVASVLSQTLKLADFVKESKKALKNENEQLHAELAERFGLNNVISSSSRMKETLSTVRKVAVTNATILLRGESGTGKTLIAKGIHFISPHRKGPLVNINCASIPETLIESELFGHQRGAFTGAVNKRVGKFEAAEGGTIFLDEIGELSLETQAKILRIIQDGAYERIGSNMTRTANVRIICATNSDLEGKLKAKLFREDLYYRLMVVPVYVPSLRSRREDILPMLSHFLSLFNEKYHKKVSISRMGIESLENYSWPGNVRELEHTIERTVILASDNESVVSEIPFLKTWENVGTSAQETVPRREEEPVAVVKKRSLYERVPLRESQVRRVLEDSAGIQTLSARKLGVSLRQLRYAVKKFGLDVREFKYL